MEIINTFEVVNRTWGFSWCGILSICLGIIIAVLAIVANEEALASIALALGISIGIIVFAEGKELPPVIQYQVILNDEISATDLLDKYEILEKQGNSYIIQERIE